MALETGWQDQVLAAFALVRASGADILQRRLPGTGEGADQHAAGSRRDFQHQGAVTRIEEWHQVDHVGVRREGLVVAGQRLRPVDDRVGRGAGELPRGLQHPLEVDRGDAPVHRLHRAAFHGTQQDGLSGQRLLGRRRRGGRWFGCMEGLRLQQQTQGERCKGGK
ncbi:hypothetical protein D9M69_625230 [compost metagenome]